jgi:hypothetical protein
VIVPAYRVAASTIAGAGKGLFLDAEVAAGAVVIAPDNLHTVWPEEKLRRYAPDSLEVQASVRWFEHWFSITPEWSDECYVNHSFTPNGLWHLGFIFALRNLVPGEELTVDYRLLLGDGEDPGFACATSGQPIVGLPWKESLRRSTAQLLQLLG